VKLPKNSPNLKIQIIYAKMKSTVIFDTVIFVNATDFNHRCNLQGSEGTSTPHFLDWGYRTPFFRMKR